MAEICIFEEQELEFSVGSGMAVLEVSPAPCALTLGETYRVVLDGVDHELVCVTTNGITSLFYETYDDSGDPIEGSFYIWYGSPEVTGMDNDAMAIDIITFASTSTHTLAIYQVVAEEVKIVLKDVSGDDKEYPAHAKIRLNMSDGTKQIYSKGEAIENSPITLDFSSGNDQTVTAPDGYLVKSAVIVKPANLIPGNIAKDVEIAGVVGTSEGSGTIDLGDDDFLNYVAYQIDPKKMELIVTGILWTKLYNETGSYDVNIPDTFGSFAVVINSEGLG